MQKQSKGQGKKILQLSSTFIFTHPILFLFVSQSIYFPSTTCISSINKWIYLYWSNRLKMFFNLNDKKSSVLVDHPWILNLFFCHSSSFDENCRAGYQGYILWPEPVRFSFSKFPLPLGGTMISGKDANNWVNYSVHVQIPPRSNTAEL